MVTHYEATDDTPEYWHCDALNAIEVRPSVKVELAFELAGKHNARKVFVEGMLYTNVDGIWQGPKQAYTISCPVDPVRDELRRENDAITQDAKAFNERHPSLTISAKVGR